MTWFFIDFLLEDLAGLHRHGLAFPKRPPYLFSSEVGIRFCAGNSAIVAYIMQVITPHGAGGLEGAFSLWSNPSPDLGGLSGLCWAQVRG